MRKILSLFRTTREPAYLAENRTYLSYKVPAAAINHCLQLSKTFAFALKVSKKRASKLGDFRYIPTQHHCLVSVNGDLTPQAFLITYLHEAAHAAAFRLYGQKIQPHGAEWQEQFRQLSQPLLTSAVFTAEVLAAFTDYLRKPSATSAGHAALAAALQLQKSAPLPLLQEVSEGERFQLRRRTFVKLGKKRTRALCRDEQNQRLYLIPETAAVKRIA